MELKEFINPENKDYDISSSLNNSNNNSNNNNNLNNPYSEQLMNLIGILEDINEEELEKEYGIGINEYLNPTADTIKKVKQRLNEHTSRKHR